LTQGKNLKVISTFPLKNEYKGINMIIIRHRDVNTINEKSEYKAPRIWAEISGLRGLTKGSIDICISLKSAAVFPTWDT